MIARVARLRFLGRGVAVIAAGAPGATALFVVLTVLASILPVAQVWLGKLVVDGLAHGAAGGGAGAAPGAAGSLSGAVLVPAVLYAGVMALGSALVPAVRTLSSRLEVRGQAEVDRRMMQAGGRLVDLVRI
jgi:hypothetical protein